MLCVRNPKHGLWAFKQNSDLKTYLNVLNSLPSSQLFLKNHAYSSQTGGIFSSRAQHTRGNVTPSLFISYGTLNISTSVVPVIFEGAHLALTPCCVKRHLNALPLSVARLELLQVITNIFRYLNGLSSSLVNDWFTVYQTIDKCWLIFFQNSILCSSSSWIIRLESLQKLDLTVR